MDGKRLQPQAERMVKRALGKARHGKKSGSLWRGACGAGSARVMLGADWCRNFMNRCAPEKEGHERS